MNLSSMPSTSSLVYKDNLSGSLQRPSLVGLSSQLCLWDSYAMVTNNLANASVCGAKALSPKLTSSVTHLPNGINVHYAHIESQIRDNSVGAFTPTGNPYDVALRSGGYFMVQTPEGKFLTRCGQFNVNSQGQLVTSAGKFAVLNAQMSPITMPSTTTSPIINNDGSIYVDNNQIGSIGIFMVKDQQQGLTNVGNNLFGTSQMPYAYTEGSIQQNGFEDSNISPVTSSTQLIKLLRAYEMVQKLIEETHQMSKRMINASPRNN